MIMGTGVYMHAPLAVTWSIPAGCENVEYPPTKVTLIPSQHSEPPVLLKTGQYLAVCTVNAGKHISSTGGIIQSDYNMCVLTCSCWRNKL